MDIWLAMYLSIALLDMACDAAMCYAAKKRYRFWPSFFACLFWVITAPLTIVGATYKTKDYPLWSEKND